MDKSQGIKAAVAGVVLLFAGILIIRSVTSSNGLTKGDMQSALLEMPVEDLISMRQALAAQVAEANRTRKGDKSEMLLGFERTLADYDTILEQRGVSVDDLGTPSIAEVPSRKGEEP